SPGSPISSQQAAVELQLEDAAGRSYRTVGLLGSATAAALIALMCRAVEDEPHVDVVRPAGVGPPIAADSSTDHDALEFPMEKSCWSTLIGSVGLVVDQRFAGGARLCATMHSRRPPGRPGRHRCRAAARYPRRPLSRSPPPRRLRGSAGRT